MSHASLHTAAILFIVVPTIEYGGYSLVRAITTRSPGYLDNPTRRMMFRAGHAHAGVWLIFALVALLYVDQTGLSGVARGIVRAGFVAGPILMPLGFFLSVIPTSSERPTKVLWLVYLGGLCLAVATVTLGIGLLRA
jgi:hypothetical protein